MIFATVLVIVSIVLMYYSEASSWLKLIPMGLGLLLVVLNIFDLLTCESLADATWTDTSFNIARALNKNEDYFINTTDDEQTKKNNWKEGIAKMRELNAELIRTQAVATTANAAQSAGTGLALQGTAAMTGVAPQD
jgi:hypothetical protein